MWRRRGGYGRGPRRRRRRAAHRPSRRPASGVGWRACRAPRRHRRTGRVGVPRCGSPSRRAGSGGPQSPFWHKPLFFWRISLHSRIWTFPGKSHVRAIAIGASKPVANRRLRPSHASVRPTAQRRDNASNPRLDGARFTASSRQRPLPSKAAASCGPASAPAAKMRSNRGNRCRIETGNSGAPSRSRIFAGRTTAATGKPQASATMRRLRPLPSCRWRSRAGRRSPVVFADWLSITPAGGLAAPPSTLRAAIAGRWSVDTRKPLSRHAAKDPDTVCQGGKSFDGMRHGQPERQT